MALPEVTGLNTLMARIAQAKEIGGKYRTKLWSGLFEYPVFFSLISTYDIDNVVESGTCAGCSSLTFATALDLENKPGKVYTWDVTSRPGVDEGSRLADRIIRYVGSFSGLDSHVVSQIEGKRLFFIDGDHTYEGCKSDFETTLPLLRKGDVVAFHDAKTHEPVHKAIIDVLKSTLMEDRVKHYMVPSRNGLEVIVW